MPNSLIPGTHWLSLTLARANDCDPEGLIGEKDRSLDYLVANDGRLFFPSYPDIAMTKVMRDRRRSVDPHLCKALKPTGGVGSARGKDGSLNAP